MEYFDFKKGTFWAILIQNVDSGWSKLGRLLQYVRRRVPCVAGMVAHVFPCTDSSPLCLCCQGNKERWWKCRKQKHQHTHPFMFCADSTQRTKSKGRERGLSELEGLRGGRFLPKKLKLPSDPVFPYFVLETLRWREEREGKRVSCNWSCITICSEREKPSLLVQHLRSSDPSAYICQRKLRSFWSSSSAVKVV